MYRLSFKIVVINSPWVTFACLLTISSTNPQSIVNLFNTRYASTGLVVMETSLLDSLELSDPGPNVRKSDTYLQFLKDHVEISYSVLMN